MVVSEDLSDVVECGDPSDVVTVQKIWSLTKCVGEEGESIGGDIAWNMY